MPTISENIKSKSRNAARSSAARSSKFGSYYRNYYSDLDSPHGAPKGKKKDGVTENRCHICDELHEMMGTGKTYGTHADACHRCIRHSLIYNFNWPLRREKGDFPETRVLQVHVCCFLFIGNPFLMFLFVV